MKVLIAPLNWGLGHATRCAELVRRYQSEGHKVVLGGDGAGLSWLRRAFPELRYVELASLELTYSKGNSQVGAMLRALPQLIRFTLEDEARLEQLLHIEPFDLVVSDNRFGLHNAGTKCVYMTHQLWIRLPKCWRWLEPLVARLHAHIYNRYDEVWVPDYENGEWRMENGEWKMENGEWRMENGEWKTENGEWRMENGEWKTLSGILGHPNGVWRMENGERRMENGEWRMEKVRYIGPLSRFTNSPIHRFTDSPYHTVALLSGLEPQRSIFEQQVMAQMAQQKGKHLLVQGKVKEPFTKLQHGNITIVPWLGDDELAEALVGAEQIICRSGYSTIMDLDRLGILDKAVFYPTPGQPEQEYLASLV